MATSFRKTMSLVMRWIAIALWLGATTGIAIADNTVVPPAKLRLLLDLLNDKEIRGYLDQRQLPKSAEAGPASPGWYSASSAAVAARLAMVRDRFAGIAATLPRLASEFDRAENIFMAEFEDDGIFYIGGYFLLFVGLGLAAERLFHLAMRPARKWLFDLRLETVNERVRTVFARFAYGLGVVLSATLGSLGAFLLIDWPPLLKAILLGYLFAQLIVRLAFAVGRLLLAPGAERFRVIPIGTPAAVFLFRRVALIAGLGAFGAVTINLLGTFGFSPQSSNLIELCLTAIVLALAIEIVWRFPRKAPSADAALVRAKVRPVANWVFTGYLVLLWVMWISASTELFWLGAFVLGMPTTTRLTQLSVDHILRPPGHADIGRDDIRSLEAVVLERGARSAIMILGALLLAYVLGIDLIALTTNDALETRLIRGALNAVMIALIADFVWQVAKAGIDQRLAATLDTQEEVGASGGRNTARLKTLLPILRSLLLVVVLVLAGMMILSALGFEIGPLIASAGVIGVALGFGSQTLVRDIISGVFYLLDDAFRVGEYIQSGSYKGTVESFSLRSVKLRHHRGALFTVPFGVLGAIQNHSRDWTIDKITIGLSYRTDLDEVRKVIKAIGAELAADPELGRDILMPLKMQGIEKFGDFAVQIRLKMMTRPGDVQFIARRKALGMIKKEFQARRIDFALPTVQVSKSEPGSDNGYENAAAGYADLRLGAAAQPK